MERLGLSAWETRQCCQRQRLGVRARAYQTEDGNFVPSRCCSSMSRPHITHHVSTTRPVFTSATRRCMLLVVLIASLLHGVRGFALSQHHPLYQSDDQAGLKEYCEWESFNASCGRGEVILMRTAKYGRMRLGKCVTKNYGHIGCGTDVIQYMDSRCSGKRRCLVPIISLHNKRSCPKDFKLYLESSYRCQKVMHPRGAELGCAPAGHQNLSAMSGFIASVTTEETGVGSRACPWLIEVEPHQRINLTLIEFAPAALTAAHHPYGMDNSYVGSSSSSITKCETKYALVSERNRTRNVTVCGGRSRETNVLLSETNIVEIIVSTERLTNRVPSHFLLRYEAFGCPPIVAPPNAWVQGDADHAVVQCNDTEETWFLTCDVTEWVGHVGNCSQIVTTEIPWTISDMFKGVTSFPFGLLIVVALGVAIGVAVGLVMLVTVLAYMKRRRQRKVRSRSNYLLKNMSDVVDNQQGKANGESATDCSPMLVKRDNFVTLQRQRDYTCNTWQMKRPLPVPSGVTGQDGGNGDLSPQGGESARHEGQTTSRTSTLPRVFTTFKPSERSEGYESPRSEREGYIIKALARDTEGPYYFKLDHITSVMDADLMSPDGLKPDLVPGCMECQERTHMQSCQSIV